MGFEALGTEEQQETDQIWDGNFEGSAAFDATNEGDDQMDLESLDPNGLDMGATTSELVDAQLSAWERGGDPMELEISKEDEHALSELRFSSMIQSATSTTDNTSASTDDSPAIHSVERSSSNDAPSSPDNTSSAEAWVCDFTNCGKTFTHRRKLKYILTLPSTQYLPANMTKSPQEVSHQTVSLH